LPRILGNFSLKSWVTSSLKFALDPPPETGHNRGEGRIGLMAKGMDRKKETKKPKKKKV
jgi:hypothetical protein